MGEDYSIRQVRESINCTVREFAWFLAIPYSTLHAVEKDRCRLPAVSRNYYFDLIDQLRGKVIEKDIKGEYLKAESKALELQIAAERARMAAVLPSLEFQFSQMKKKYASGLAVLDRLGKISISTPGAHGKSQKRWLENLISVEKARIEKYNLVAQYNLGRKIASMKAEMLLK